MANTLWDFAVARYQRSGVAECCLRLQDNAGADINMLLAAAWLAEQGRYWQHDQVRELIALSADWREHCILPLRAVRRYLKDRIETPALYTQTQVLELEAEMHQLHLLHTALQANALKTHEATDADALAANLNTYFDCIASTRPIMDADRCELIEALYR